jgi:hypothetical protein
MKVPDFTHLKRDILNGDPGIILSELVEKMKKRMLIEDIRQYFFDFLDYIIRFGSEHLQDPIRDVLNQL